MKKITLENYLYCSNYSYSMNFYIKNIIFFSIDNKKHTIINNILINRDLVIRYCQNNSDVYFLQL